MGPERALSFPVTEVAVVSAFSLSLFSLVSFSKAAFSFAKAAFLASSFRSPRIGTCWKTHLPQVESAACSCPSQICLGHSRKTGSLEALAAFWEVRAYRPAACVKASAETWDAGME